MIPKEIWASVTERGQVTIPAEVRKALGLKKGDKVIFRLEEGRIVLKKPPFTIETAAGSIPPLKTPMDWEEVSRIAHEEVAERYFKKMREGNA